MGRNAAIRRFDARKSGQPLGLFGADGRRPVVLELLASGFVSRASDLAALERTEVEVPVEWDAERGRPSAFHWKQKRYVVDAVVQQWATDTHWWDRDTAQSRRCFRVIARGGVYDLACDRLAGRWLLLSVVD